MRRRSWWFCGHEKRSWRLTLHRLFSCLQASSPAYNLAPMLLARTGQATMRLSRLNVSDLGRGFIKLNLHASCGLDQRKFLHQQITYFPLLEVSSLEDKT
ncbi:unnamed protein product [Musa hybrid cultivar]